MTVAVIGYGNELRRDDGVGPWLAHLVASWGLAGVEVRALHQLVPELTDLLGVVDEVIFVDAAVDVGEGTRVTEVVPGPTWRGGHRTEPEGLLALTRLVSGRCPRGRLVRVGVMDLGIGEGLSEQARRGAAEAERWLRDELTSCRPGGEEPGERGAAR